ncbi:unnamed protein product [Effrenium voratum]|nr:unnamed protein product [Effrenium voratum]
MLSSSAAAFLEQNRSKDAQSFNYNRNHVGMTVIAMDLLSQRFPDEQWPKVVAIYCEDMVPELDARPVPTFGGAQDLDAVVTDETLEVHLGKPSYATAFARYFFGKAAALGGDADKIPTLMSTYFIREVQHGVHAAAFHALLRISFGIDAGDAGEVAAGLAYLYSGHAPVPLSTSPAAPVEGEAIKAAVAKLLQNEQLLMRVDVSECKSLQARQEAYFKVPEFMAAVDAFPHKDMLAVMAAMDRVFVELYGQYHDFSVLHCVTGANALRAVLPFLLPEGVSAAWAATLATVGCTEALRRQEAPLTQAAPLPLPDELSSGVVDWATLCHEMLCRLVARRKSKELSSSAFEHTVKLMYALLQIKDRYPELDEALYALMKREVVAPSPFR